MSNTLYDRDGEPLAYVPLRARDRSKWLTDRDRSNFKIKKYYEQTEIGSRVGRNQTTVMQICDHCMQEGTTDRRGRSHPPQCTTSREDRQIVKDHSVSSRTVAQHIESVRHHSVSARTIRCRLQQSGLFARRSLLDAEPQTSPP
ncbi:transposable element Tcb1 transposase [Trichonephila clavipes]|nr:transposable element Tcb1 transposase [Trichonephila clavipes]